MKFELSNFVKLWSDSNEGRKIMSAILADPEMIEPHFTFWKNDFMVDPEVTPTNALGVSTFYSEMRELDNGVMMDMRAPLGDTIPEDKKGGKYYTGSIPDYSARGYVETAMERMDKEARFDQFADAKFLAEFAQRDLQRMVNSANQTLSYQAAYLLSRGQLVYKKGEGIQASIEKANIPAANFMRAGKTVWSDPSALIITQMIEIQDKIKDALPVDINFKWQIKKEMWTNVFMKNKQVLEFANNMRTIETGGVPMPNTYALPSNIVKKYLDSYEGLDPIEIVEEKQKDINDGIIHGWADGIAVYRPVGYAGMIRHADILDKKVYEKYGNKVNAYNFVEALGGVAMFMNSEVVNGNFKEWHTDLFMKAVPTLDEFLYHYIINTAQADE